MWKFNQSKKLTNYTIPWIFISAYYPMHIGFFMVQCTLFYGCTARAVACGVLCNYRITTFLTVENGRNFRELFSLHRTFPRGVAPFLISPGMTYIIYVIYYIYITATICWGVFFTMPQNKLCCGGLLGFFFWGQRFPSITGIHSGWATTTSGC